MSKGPDMPDAPDLSELEDFFKKSATWSYGNAKDMMKWAQAAYAENKSLGGQFIDSMLGQMDKYQAWQDADRAFYEDTYQPLERMQAERAASYASPERQEYEAGRAEADVAAQVEQARRSSSEQLRKFGVDPSQLKQGSLDLGTRVAEAAMQAGAGNNARRATEMYGDQLMAQSVNTGRGYPQQYTGQGQMGNQSGMSGVNSGLATTTSGAQTMGTPYQWQTIGDNAVGQWGNMLNNQYATQVQAAANSGGSGLGSILGLGANIFGKATGYWEEGGAIPDDGDYLEPEMSPSGGGIPDDIDAEMPGGGPAKLNAGEFIVPKDVVEWLGEKGMQQIILKARKEMANGEKRPAQPEYGPTQPMTPPRGVMSAPEMEDMA